MKNVSAKIARVGVSVGAGRTDVAVGVSVGVGGTDVAVGGRGVGMIGVPHALENSVTIVIRMAVVMFLVFIFFPLRKPPSR